jgi:hypothetical protein
MSLIPVFNKNSL